MISATSNRPTVRPDLRETTVAGPALGQEAEKGETSRGRLEARHGLRVRRRIPAQPGRVLVGAQTEGCRLPIAIAADVPEFGAPLGEPFRALLAGNQARGAAQNREVHSHANPTTGSVAADRVTAACQPARPQAGRPQ